MCFITGYGDGATGYLGAVAGNGLGKFSKLEKYTSCTGRESFVTLLGVKDSLHQSC